MGIGEQVDGEHACSKMCPGLFPGFGLAVSVHPCTPLPQHHNDLPMKKAPEYHYLEAFVFAAGAACRIRTDDLPLTRRLLYQLS